MKIDRVYSFLGTAFRRRRMELFRKLFVVARKTRILDLGGAPETWRGQENGSQVILVNLDKRCLEGDPGSVVADALACPFADEQFDFVFSNSLIEHLSTAERQEAFAVEVRRLSRNGYFVQTPNRHFPIEPHYLAPLVQFVPKLIRPAIVRWMTPWGWITKPTKTRCINLCQEIRLLDACDMERLFPDAEIVRERLFGVTKSLIAICRASGPHRGAPSRIHENLVRP